MDGELQLLIDLGREFDLQPKCNPPLASCNVFEAYLLEQGIDPWSFSERTWWAYLSMKGMDGNEIMDYLIGAAEWTPIT